MPVPTPTLSERITDDMKVAMRAKDSSALAVLRGLKSAFKYAAIEKKGGADAELSETEALSVVRKQIKQRQDSAESFRSAGRDDLLQVELAEIAVLESYLPQALTDAEVEALVDRVIADQGATSRKDMGPVMKTLQDEAAGRADNKVLSGLVMKRLA
ncbi:GatB/YqeY domain-containing protein [soil metagenome]